jgi:hypothetical protein
MAADEGTLDALIQLTVASRLARDSLANLPAEARGALRDVVEEFCGAAERELARLHALRLTPQDRIA